MDLPHTTTEASKTSMDAVIQHLKVVRDNRIQELLQEDVSLMDFLEVHYNTIAISAIKKEFLRRDLTELKASSLDLVHYSSLIKEMKEQTSTSTLESHPLLINELKNLFRKYGF